MTKEQFKVIENYMLLNTKSSSHDKMHTYRVLNNALKIAKKEKNVNMGILIASALLHDIAREKELKGWKREKKEALIAKSNPLKTDLEEELEWI